MPWPSTWWCTIYAKPNWITLPQLKPSTRGGQIFFLQQPLREVGELAETAAAWAGVAASDEARCLVANLICAAQLSSSIVISRRPDAYVRPPRGCYPSSNGVGFRPFIRTLDAFVRAGLIIERRGERGLRGEATEIAPTPTFTDLAAVKGWRLLDPGDPLGLQLRALDPDRRGRYTLVDWGMGDRIALRMQAELAAVNELNARFTVMCEDLGDLRVLWDREGEEEKEEEREEKEAGTEQAPTPCSPRAHLGPPYSGSPFTSATTLWVLPVRWLQYTRIFHLSENGSTWGMHGRFYSTFQSLSSAARQTIRVNGDPTVELDVSGMHPTILYHTEGLEAPPDPYTVPGLDPELREVYKVATLILLNAASRRIALGALKHKIIDDKLQLPPGVGAADILTQMEQAHEPIAHHFYKATGKWVMNRDSEIAAGVMRRLVEWARSEPGEAVPALVIHDGYLVPSRAEPMVYMMLLDAYQEVMGPGRIPRVKRTAPDGTKSFVNPLAYERGVRA